MNQVTNIIEVKSVSKSFLVGGQVINVLKGIDLQIKLGDFAVIFGPSGCGKSTLLHTILGLEPPTKGSVLIDNKPVYDLSSEDDRSIVRKNIFGMVYQQANWIRSLSVVENVAFPLALAGERRVDFRKQKAKEMLDLFNMADWADYSPSELSSGQQQLVALARAIITDPKILIADEPTGNLDFESGQKLMEIIAKLNQEKDKTVLMVTHDLEYLEYAITGVQMLDGEIIETFRGSEKQTMISKIRSKRDLKNEE